MSNKTLGVYNLTAPVIVSHPHFFEAVAFMRNGKPQGEPKFGGSFLFDLDSQDLTNIKALAVKLAKAKWPDRDVIAESKGRIVTGEDDIQTRLPPSFKFPFTSGDTIANKRVAKLKAEGKEDDKKGDFQRGKVVIKTSSKYAPRLAVLVNGKPTDLDTPEKLALYKNQFYFGVKALAQFDLNAYDKVGETGIDGVTIYCNMVLSLNKGERLTGGQSAAEVFKGYSGEATPEDPTATMDDEIPF